MAKKSTKKAPVAVKKPIPKRASKPAQAPAKVTKKQPRTIIGDHIVGQHYGVTSKSIYNWRKEGMPATALPGNQWQYDLDKTDPWVEAKRQTGEGDEDLAAIRKEIAVTKLRSERAKAADLERRNELAEGNVLDRSATELAVCEAIQATRDKILRIPTLFHGHLCKKCQPKTEELRSQLEHALTELATKLRERPDDDEDT